MPTPLALAARTAAPPVVQAPGARVPSTTGRPVFLSNYATPQRDMLIMAAQQARLPNGTAVIMGTYGVNGDEAADVHRLPSGVYAPIVTPTKAAHPTRQLRPFEEALYDRQHPGLARFKGELPKLAELSPAERRAWGVEMGRRIRDQIRRASTVKVDDPASPTGYRLQEKFHVDSFQLDEIWPSLSKGGQVSHTLMQFFTGVMKGVREGRPELGDRPMRGSVMLAHPGAFARLPHSADKRAFLSELNRTASFLIGEAYPGFRGGAAGADREADRFMAGSRELMDDGPDGRALAKRYVIGGTPGMKPGRSLGGRLHEDDRNARPTQSIAAAHAWRSEFIRESIEGGSRGFSQFSWTRSNPKFFDRPGLNHSQQTMNLVLRQIAQALRG